MFYFRHSPYLWNFHSVMQIWRRYFRLFDRVSIEYLVNYYCLVENGSRKAEEDGHEREKKEFTTH